MPLSFLFSPVPGATGVSGPIRAEESFVWTNQRAGLRETQARSGWGQPGQADKLPEIGAVKKNMCEEFGGNNLFSDVFDDFFTRTMFFPSMSVKSVKKSFR